MPTSLLQADTEMRIMRAGASEPFAGTARVPDRPDDLPEGEVSLPSTFTIVDTPTVTLFDTIGNVVRTESAVTDLVSGPAPEVSAIFVFDSTGLEAGYYLLVFTLKVTGDDGFARTFKPSKEIQILSESAPAFPVQAYVSADELKTYLLSLAVFNPATFERACALIDLPGTARAVGDEWERRTCWHPFLSPGFGSESRSFDPPAPPGRRDFGAGGGKLLKLRSGLLRLDSLALTSPGFSASPLVRGSDFFLTDSAGDYNAEGRGLANTRIVFTRPLYGPLSSLVVTGEWGYCRTLPAEVKSVCIDYAALLCVAQIRLNITRGLFSFRDLNTEIRFASAAHVPLKEEEAGWKAGFEARIAGYMRPIAQ